MSVSSQQLTLKKGAPGDQGRDLLPVTWKGSIDVDDAPESAC